MSTSKFAETHNLIAFLEKPEESSGFEDIIDFLNANQIRYALIFNPTIYTSCIEQFWVTAKVKTFNGERQLQALVDKKKSLKRRVKSLEKRKQSRTSGFKRLRKVGSASRVESFNDASLGAQEDASKQGRKIDDLDVNAEVTLEKGVAEKEVSVADPVTTAGEVVTTANLVLKVTNVKYAPQQQVMSDSWLRL
ncbi:hypothetical protein Tco_1040400 [Tanacetum coccineum]